MMMHGGDMMGHGSDHQTQEQKKYGEERNNQQKSETSVDQSSAHSTHEEEHKHKKSKTWLILGGIGMGLMMAIMVL